MSVFADARYRSDNRLSNFLTPGIPAAAFVFFVVALVLLTGCASGPPVGPGSLQPPPVVREEGFLYSEGYASGAPTVEEARFSAERIAREQAASSMRTEIRAEMEAVNDELTSRFEQRALARVEALEFVSESHGLYTDEIGRSLYESYVILRMPRPEDRWRETLRRLDAMEQETRRGSLRERMQFLRTAGDELEGMYGVVSVSGGRGNVAFESFLEEEQLRLPGGMNPRLEPTPEYGGQILARGVELVWADDGPQPTQERIRITITDGSGQTVLEQQGMTDIHGRFAVEMAVVPIGSTMNLSVELSDYPEIVPMHWSAPLRPPVVAISFPSVPPDLVELPDQFSELCRRDGFTVAGPGAGADIEVTVILGQPELQPGDRIRVVQSDIEITIRRAGGQKRTQAQLRAVGATAEQAFSTFPAAANAQLIDLLKGALSDE